MADEHLYAKAVGQYRSENRDPALLAKAYTLARGDEKTQEFEYIKLRVAQLRAEPVKAIASAAVSQGRKWWPLVKKVALWLFGLWVLAIVLIVALGVR